MSHRCISSRTGTAAEPSLASIGGSDRRGRSVIETGALIARIFDLLEASSLESFAPQVASGLVNGARRPLRT
ncbi:hypothetical protein [Sphingomonas sp. 1185]|uniref:hypothetical protein n=1 Tax=Sphingomonas sp. 1185 TaxID=3156411 RepID=UPI003394E898